MQKMSEENVGPANSQDATDNQKVQKLVIYLPEGSVILDRTEMDQDELPDGILNYTKRATTTPTNQPIEVPVTEQPRTGVNTSVPPFDIPVPAHPRAALTAPERVIYRRRWYRSSWMHATNITFVVAITLSALLPGALATFFGIELYASKVNVPNASIYRGDLMISKTLPVFELKPNDVVLLHDVNTWNLQVRQVISTIFASDMATLTTSDGGIATVPISTTIQNTTPMHKVTRIVPKLGYWVVVITSTIMKISLGIFLIALNIIAYWRRERRRRWLRP